MLAEAKRRRGAPKGNQNARKHGFYSKVLDEAEQLDFELAAGELPCQTIQCDEIWSFCYAKEKNVPENKQGRFGYGDVWTWVAIDADTSPNGVLTNVWFVL